MCPGIGESIKNSLLRYKNRPYRGKPPEWWEKQKGSRGIRRGQWYRLVFNFLYVKHLWIVGLNSIGMEAFPRLRFTTKKLNRKMPGKPF
ncbi:hypothetical protein EAO17_31050 [Klebsiella pneumoniae]|uniref:Uncharacterized protein n=1 Tax=Klebsiella pneumoniae TaxID=573 RepID=A0ABD7J3L7_KLEPN|nr:hypothetical protein EAO17_31050 [Klebsiella pneumoniae]